MSLECIQDPPFSAALLLFGIQAHAFPPLPALAAHTFTVRLHVQVVPFERVPVHASIAARVFSGTSDAAQDVGPVLHWLEVGRVDAGSVAAEVVKHKAIGDRAYAVLVCKAVSSHAEASPNAEDPVAVLVAERAPFPARLRLLNFRPESVRGCPPDQGHVFRISEPAPPVVVAVTPASGSGSVRTVRDAALRHAPILSESPEVRGLQAPSTTARSRLQ